MEILCLMVPGIIYMNISDAFLLFYTDKPTKLRNALRKTKLNEVKFKFDFEGVKRIL